MQIFISHAREDKEFAHRLGRDLAAQSKGRIQQTNVPIFAGEVLDEAILNRIGNSAVVLVLISKRTDSSRWVSTEISLALSKGRPVIPVVIDKRAEIPFFIRHLAFIDLSREADYEKNVIALVEAIHRSTSKVTAREVLVTDADGGPEDDARLRPSARERTLAAQTAVLAGAVEQHQVALRRTQSILTRLFVVTQAAVGIIAFLKILHRGGEGDTSAYETTSWLAVVAETVAFGGAGGAVGYFLGRRSHKAVHRND